MNTQCAGCGAELRETADCRACIEPLRYDDHLCDGYCADCHEVRRLGRTA